DFMTGEDWVSIANGEQGEFATPDGLEVKILNPENVRNVLLPDNSQKPLFVFVSGASESGKSTFGRVAVESGIAHRLKVYKTLAEISGEDGLPEMEGNPFDYATSLLEDPSLIDKAGDI